jgi:hypothetical protein
MVKRHIRPKSVSRSSSSKLKPTKQVATQGLASKRSLIILYIFFVVVVGWLLIHLARTTYERQQYTQAQANLDGLYAEIVAAVGKPDKTKDDARCGYVSQEFGRGPRYCDIEKAFLYLNISKQKAELIAKKINDVVKSSKRVEYVREYRSVTSDIGRKDLASSLFTTAGIQECGTDLAYVTPQTIEEYTSIGDKNTLKHNGLSVVIDCSGGSQKEYFPVKN